MDTVKIDARDVNFWYGDFHALKGISMQIEEKSVVAFIGPSGCGKSTFLRLFNRMNDLIPATRLEGEIRIDGQNIYAKGVEVDELRKNVGMVFQRPNPFPKSIFENVAYGLRVNGVKDNAFIRQRVEETLKGAALWDEVKDKLKESAYALSGGQQQRLCKKSCGHDSGENRAHLAYPDSGPRLGDPGTERPAAGCDCPLCRATCSA